MQEPLEGQQIGRYLIHQKLGGGGVATVFQATDQVSGQAVALKLLPPNPDPATLDRFRREALLAGALHQPNIVRILQVGTVGDGTSAYIAMELVEGESLAALLARVGHLQPEESCRLLEPIARALAYAHRNGVIHRDVKPSNILLHPISPDSNVVGSANGIFLESAAQWAVPMLSDFGIARFADAPELTSEGRTIGTPAFMAPEQCMGSRAIDGRADIYSLGTVLYRCVVGRLPFNGSTTQILHAHVFEPVVIDEEMVRRLPPKMVEVLQRTLAKAPEERFQDGDQLADALASVGTSAVGGVLTEATTTMTVAALPANKAPTTSAVQVLVAAPSHAGGHATGDVAMSDTRVKNVSGSKSQRAPEPFWSKAMWAIFFVLLIGIGGWWSVRSWLDAQPEETSLELPRLIVRTVVPSSDGVGSVNGQAVISSTTPSALAVIQPSPTSLPSETPAPMPTATATEIPTQAPTAVPTIFPTEMVVVEVPTPAMVITGVVTPIASEVITPSEEIAGACSTLVDEFFINTVNGLSGEAISDFACPTEEADVETGGWLPFERGVMVAVDGQPYVYLYYSDGSWEQVVTGASNPSPDVEMPPIPAPFAEIWAAEGRNLRLGDALQAEPQSGEIVIQPFAGGVMIGNRNSGEVLLLARSMLRF